MGAQAAALLDGGGPVGDVPADGPWTGELQLQCPPSFDLARTALVHGGVGLAPTAWDGRRLHLRLPDPVVVEPEPVARSGFLAGAGPASRSAHASGPAQASGSGPLTGPGLTMRWRGRPPDVAVLRRVLALDDDLEELWAACDRVPSLRWVRTTGAGRVLRSPTVWQDLVGTLAGTRASYRSTQAMVRSLVGDGPFPGPQQVLDGDLTAWGYRASWLRRLAEQVAGGLDVEGLADPEVTDAEAELRVRGLAGFGPFAAAQLLPLLGRPRPLVLDGWLREQLGGASDAQVHERYAAMGRWAGTGAWLEVLAPRLAGPGGGRGAP